MSNADVSTKPCRRCTECVGEEHHWSDEYVEFAEDGPDCWLVCKHCPAWKPYPDDEPNERLNLSCGKCGAVITVRAKDVEGYQIDPTSDDRGDYDQHVTCPFHYGSTYWMFATEEPL